MLWVMADVAIGVLAVLALVAVAFALYKRVRGLMRTVSAASDRVSDASAGMNEQQRQTATRS